MTEQLRVLVVDEEETLTKVVGIALGLEGWQVRAIARGAEAVDAALDFVPHAILLDISLPDTNGVDVAAQLRASGVVAPILFLTGHDSLEDRLAAYAAGGDDYITKPFGLGELASRVRTWLPRAA